MNEFDKYMHKYVFKYNFYKYMKYLQFMFIKLRLILI